MKTTMVRTAVLIAVVVGAARVSYGQADAAVILQFQRAADSYAFAHRQSDRRNTPAPLMTEGQFFTPIVAAAFRARIRNAVSVAGCDAPRPGEGGSEVPAVNTLASSADALPQCVAAALPRIPPELEYRVAGVALILADTRNNVVVDVLHGAFP
jgi:hypothetical protein